MIIHQRKKTRHQRDGDVLRCNWPCQAAVSFPLSPGDIGQVHLSSLGPSVGPFVTLLVSISVDQITEECKSCREMITGLRQGSVLF